MLARFEKLINGRTYKFTPISEDAEWVYNISYIDEGTTTTFRVKKDEEGMWKIAAQILPIDIHESSLSLHDAIEDENI